MEEEKWRPIPFCDGMYDVSNFGNVRSHKYGRTTILKQGTDRYGYKTVVLSADGKQKTYRVHRIVACVFIPKRDGRDFIDHIDTNKSNNHYSNLRWVTKSENNRNPITYQKFLDKIYNRDQAIWDEYVVPVYQYTFDRYFVKKYPSISAAARENNLMKSGIRFVIRGKYKKCGGFIWTTSPL